MNSLRSKLSGPLDLFPTITLEQMGKVRLMNRVDTKYVTTGDKLLRFLHAASAHYYVQEIDGEKVMPYATCYFDTADCAMFAEHQRGRKTRQKIRMRCYEGSGLAFLEIKSKNNKGRTKKKRMQAEYGSDVATYADFINKHSRYNPDGLVAQLKNRFSRITLVNKAMTERLTIDLGLSFHNVTQDRDRSMDGLVIIELKREGGNSVSPALDILRELRIHPAGFSKYCVGMALTNGTLRRNRIKEKLRRVARMLGWEEDPMNIS